MKLKTFSLLLALIICGSFTALAQNNGNPNAGSGTNGISSNDGNTKEKDKEKKTPEQVAQSKIEQLGQDIVLSGQQKTAVSQAALEWAQKRQQIIATMEMWSKEYMDAVKSVDAAYEEVLKSKLTTEQQEELTAKREQRKKEAMQVREKRIEEVAKEKNKSK